MRLCKKTKGASGIEYGILVGLIAVAGISTVFNFGTQNKDTFDGVTTTLAERVLGIGGSGGDAGTDGSGGSIVLAPNGTAENCYDPANIDTIGQTGWTGCEGMLIVDNAMLRGAAASSNGGNNSYAIAGPDGNTYTFEDSSLNVFTGQVTDMSYTFYGEQNANLDVGYWDTSNVTNMSWMFAGGNAVNYEAEQKFNQDISGWDTSRVEDMSFMFFNARHFNQDIGSWDVSNVTGMVRMFDIAPAFNQDISGWCVSNISSMPGRFADNSGFDGNTAIQPQWGTCP